MNPPYGDHVSTVGLLYLLKRDPVIFPFIFCTALSLCDGTLKIAFTEDVSFGGEKKLALRDIFNKIFILK